MLTPKQKAILKSHANTISQRFQLGKGAMTASFVDMVDKALEAHELVKVSILKNSELDMDDVAETLTLELSCDIVQSIGRVLVLYRPSKHHPRHLI